MINFNNCTFSSVCDVSLSSYARKTWGSLSLNMCHVSNAWIQGRSEVLVYGEKAEQRSCAGEAQGQGTHSRTPRLSRLTVNRLEISAPETVEEDGRVGLCVPCLGCEFFSCRSPGGIKALVSTCGDSVRWLLML